MNLVRSDYVPEITRFVTTTPAGDFGDLAAANRPMTMHQAALPIMVFGHRIRSMIIVNNL